MWVFVAVIALLIGQSPSFARAAFQSSDVRAVLDLPYMAVTLADLNALGLDGFVHRNSQFLLADSLGDRQGELFLESDDQVVELLVDGGAVAGYELYLDHFDEDGLTTERVRTTVVQFEDERGAEAWFSFAEESVLGDVQDAADYGDVSELSEAAGRSTEFDRMYSEADYAVVVGSIYADVQKLNVNPADTTRIPTAPSSREMESLVETLVERIEAGLDGDTPDLGQSTLHFQNAGLWYGTVDSQEIATFVDAYTTVDGEYLPLFDEDQEIAAEYTADNEARGIVSEYHYWGTYGYADDEFLPQFESWTRQWDSEAQAAAYVIDPETVDELYDNAELIMDVEALGDNSAFYSFEFEEDGETAVGYIGFVQYGDITYRLSLSATEPFDFAVLEELIEDQDDCVSDGYCESESAFPVNDLAA